ncbi:MAG: hypothetical protein U9N36_05405 [Euryarchaeota archaeon]|nr:hypothetical protein [Euryarchaeota archaeon]
MLDGLKNSYLEMEGVIEERMDDVTGDMRGRIDRCGDRRRGRRVESKDGGGSGVRYGCDVGVPNRRDVIDEKIITK